MHFAILVSLAASALAAPAVSVSSLVSPKVAPSSGLSRNQVNRNPMKVPAIPSRHFLLPSNPKSSTRQSTTVRAQSDKFVPREGKFDDYGEQFGNNFDSDFGIPKQRRAKCGFAQDSPNERADVFCMVVAETDAFEENYNDDIHGQKPDVANFESTRTQIGGSHHACAGGYLQDGVFVIDQLFLHQLCPDSNTLMDLLGQKATKMGASSLVISDKLDVAGFDYLGTKVPSLLFSALLGHDVAYLRPFVSGFEFDPTESQELLKKFNEVKQMPLTKLLESIRVDGSLVGHEININSDMTLRNFCIHLRDNAKSTSRTIEDHKYFLKTLKGTIDLLKISKQFQEEYGILLKEHLLTRKL